MKGRKKQEKLRRELHDLLWSPKHWVFVGEEQEAQRRLTRLGELPEVRQWGGEYVGYLIEDLGPGVPPVFVGGIPKALLPPQVMSRLLERCQIGYTARFLAGLAPVLFLCREVSRGLALMEALAAFVGDTRFAYSGHATPQE